MEETKTNEVASKEKSEEGLNGWSLVLGSLLILTGLFAIMTPVATTLFTEVFISWFLILVGSVQFINAIVERQTGGLWMGIFMGLFAFVLGILLMSHTIAGLVSITMIIGILFVVYGVVKTITAVTVRPPHWGWLLISGLILIVIAVMILTNLIFASLALMGILMGIYMVFVGIEVIVRYYSTKK